MGKWVDAGMKDPLTIVINEMAKYFSEIFHLDEIQAFRLIQPPPREELGDISFPLLRFTRRYPSDERAVVETLKGRIWERGIRFIDMELNQGFLNIRFDETALSKYVYGIMINGWKPEPAKVEKPRRIVVEHTSANPIHPLHMGHARNTSLGDTVSRMLQARGHEVNRRFYINDAGRQVAVAALGFKVSGIKPRDLIDKTGWKPDKAIGWVYALTHTTIDISTLKKKAEEGDRESLSKLDSLVAALSRIRQEGPEDLADAIIKSVSELEDPDSTVSSIMARYEKGLEPEKSLIREITTLTLEGFKTTLSRLDVSFDAWDWESDLIWSGLVSRIVEEARKSRYAVTFKGALAIDIPRIIKELVKRDPEAARRIKLPKGFEIPPLIILRSDGTTLYTTRDIAYSVYKFRAFNADQVINVIGADQRLPQLQIRLALLGLGYRDEALNMMHYDYEIVRLPGRKMSSRRGELVSLDGVLEEAKARAADEVRKRNPGASPEWVDSVSEKIAVGALRFTLVQTSPLKPVTLSLERILDLEENTGPYLQYTYARAHNILEKHGPIDYKNIDYTASSDPQRRRLLLMSLRYPLVSAKAADDMAPEDLANYLLKLADEFNSWYQRDTVIHEQSEGKRNYKAMLVKLVMSTLEDGMRLLGVPPIPKM